jgi:hypothetical protein
MRVEVSGIGAYSIGYGVPLDTVPCFVSCAVYRSLLLGRTDSVYYRTESVSPLRPAFQSVPNVPLVIVVPCSGIS